MNTHQLVIRCDTTNGYYKVGWTSELPLGRFTHRELLLESQTLFTFDASHPIFEKTCSQISELNTPLIIKERDAKLALGWLPVSLNLHDNSSSVSPDEFGSFYNLATNIRYRLTKNSRDVWGVINGDLVLHVEARYPKRRMLELEYQIWKNHKLEILRQYNGVIEQGKLITCNSGLWFVVKIDD